MVCEGDFDGADDFGFDASVLAEFGEEVWGAFSSFAEVEVVAFDDEVWGVCFDDLVDEGFGVLGEEIWSGGEFDDLVGSGGDQESFADVEGVDLGGGFFWVEVGHGMGVEAQYNHLSSLSYALPGPLDEHLVA